MTDLFAARSQMAISLAFHIIFAVVGIGMPVLMVVAERRWQRTGDRIFLELALMARGRDLSTRRWLLRALVAPAPMGFICTEAGWVVTEVGRQPWVIYGVLRTAEAVTPMPGLVVPFATFTLLYCFLYHDGEESAMQLRWGVFAIASAVTPVLLGVPGRASLGRRAATREDGVYEVFVALWLTPSASAQVY
jgi:cytochrome bd-type quinol oxidase subunit 1